ncbi:dephospho-CoA kinase [Tenacibaculum adriaticum]|uniref:Dephospho-CoA kinase n=1 Tax=Tenacibaculum adriaticum TaxID=413713 RepID=A0A5S5DQY6_9FLAO|nr:dephospho-CoA kinase [Tenacibaculum adriaticum]TYP98301.1 dephospho-CoA kinase [Tenacibaculum adriaticum]
MVVGLTGGIGSGKTTVAKMFSKFENVVVYFADDEAKKLMNTSLEIKTKLTAAFTEEVYKEGVLNRPFLANIVFKNKEKLAVLNGIVHPVVYQHLQSFIAANKKKEYILYENAILFENGSNRMCDKIITVTAPKSIKIQRVISRDTISKEEVENRMKNQWSDAKKILQSHYVIDNQLLKDTELQVLNIHNKLTKRY